MNLEHVLRRAERDEILRGLLVSKRDLHHLSGGKVVREPRLTTFPLTSDRVSHKEAVVRVALPLNVFCIEELASVTARTWRVSVNSFYSEIHLLQTGNARQIHSGSHPRPSRRGDRADIVVNQRIGVQRDPVRQE